MKKRNILTTCVHAGTIVDPEVGGVVTPIHISSSYRYNSGDICYPRYQNIPTQKAAADKIAALENAEAGLVLGSGLGAISTVLMSLLKSGDHAVIQSDIYGGTFHFAEAELSRLNIEYTMVSDASPASFEAAIRPNTKLLYIETPSNPLMKITDIEATADMARKRNIRTVIDNTFATPINQTPLDLGIDVVVHSGTKYLSGHSDLCCGVVACSNALMDRIKETAVNFGAPLTPAAASLLERSLKTLGIRIRQHNENGMALAEALQGHPKVTTVHYPGLKSHPRHEIAARQMRGFGGMLSLDLSCSKDEAREIVGRLEVASHAVSLGGVETLVCFPALTSHEKMPQEEREKIGITDTLIRISTGIEDSEDIIQDFLQALA